MRKEISVFLSVWIATVCLCCRGGELFPDPEAPPPVIRQLKRLYPKTPLATAGKSTSLIVTSQTPELSAVAEELRAILEAECGTEFTVLQADALVGPGWQVDLDTIGSRHVIALGNVNNNRLLAILYGQRYVVADSIYPGKDGYVIRTIHDPFARGINVLGLLGSDGAGVHMALESFVNRFIKGRGGNVALDEPYLEVEFERKAYRFFPDSSHSLSSKRQPQYTGLDWFREQWQKTGVMSDDGTIITCTRPNADMTLVTGLIARMGQTYFRTGNRELLPMMKGLLDTNRGLLTKRARLHGMGGRTADHVHQWDLLEELPIWTDQDRLDMTNALLSDAAMGHERRAFHTQVRDGCVQCVDENHGTHSALHTLHAWSYFDKYYNLPESDYWMKCADAVFAGQASTFQILEDASGYLCYCPQHAVEYSLNRGNLRYLDRGVARHHARYLALACMNNLGFSSGFGDSGGLIQPALFELLAPVAWYHKDPYLYWIIRERLPQACGLRIFQNSYAIDMEVPTEEPKEWTGLIKFPIYEAPLVKGDGVREPVFAPKKVVDDKLFNKIVFKENWDPDGQYLLLDGAGAWDGPPGPHGHKHDDINTIINFTAFDRMWLVDHTYQVRGFDQHSGVYAIRNGRGGYEKRTLAEEVAFGDCGDYGLTRTHFMAWDRAIFWRKGRYFLIIDRQEADEDGELFARCSFRALGKELLRGKGLFLEQNRRFCKIVSDGDANVDVDTYRFTSDHWETFYEHADPVVRIFQQDKKRVLKKGEAIGFINLLFAYPDPEQENAVRMRPVSEFSALIEDGTDRTLLGIGDIPGGHDTAAMFVVSDHVLHALQIEELCDGVLSCNPAADVSIWPAENSLEVSTKAGCVVMFSGTVSGVEGPNGEIETTQADKATTVALPPGRHRLRIRGWEASARVAEFAEHVLIAADGLARQRATTEKTGIDKEVVEGVRVEVRNLSARIITLVQADVNGDDAKEWVVGTDQAVVVFTSGGKVLWTFSTKAPVRAIDVGDLDRDGTVETVIGADDDHVYLLDNTGTLQWSFQCKASEGSVDGDPAVEYVKLVDLDGDGIDEIVAGANWVHVLNADGSLRWERYMDLRRGRVSGDFICGTVEDITGDGIPEIVALFMTSYPLLQVLDTNGNMVVPSNYEEGHGHRGLNIGPPVAVAALDLFGGSKSKQLVCATNSRIDFFWHDHKRGEQGGGKIGGPCVAMTHFQPDPAMPPWIIGATPMCGIYGVRPQPKRDDRWIHADIEWQRTLDEKITKLVALSTVEREAGVVVVGTKQGNVYLFDIESGKPCGKVVVHGAPVVSVQRGEEPGTFIIAKEDGTILTGRLDEK